MRFLQERAKEFEKHIDEMSNSSKIAVLHDADPDGICAALQLDAYLKSVDKRIDWRIHPLTKEKAFSQKWVSTIIEKEITHIIILDYSLSGYGRGDDFIAFKEAHPTIKVLVIDHHPHGKDLPFDYHANTAFDQTQISPDQYCTSKFIFDLLSCIWSDVSKLDWIASIGMIGDWNAKTWGLFIQEALKKENERRLKMNLEGFSIPKEFEEYFATPYGKIALQIFYGIAKNPKEISYIYDTLQKSTNNVDDTVKAFDKYLEISDEVDDYIDNFEYCKKNTPIEKCGLRIFEVEVKSQYDILVITSNLISLKDKDTIFLLYERRGNDYVVGVRYQKADIHMGNIMKTVSGKIKDSNGGGHPAAAGGRFPKESFDKFKELFYEELEQVKQ